MQQIGLVLFTVLIIIKYFLVLRIVLGWRLTSRNEQFTGENSEHEQAKGMGHEM